MKVRNIVALSLLASGALAAGVAQAHENLRWSVTVGSPAPVVRAPVLVSAPVLTPVMVPVGYHHDRRDWRPTRWDVDGDGIPNRHDRYDDRRVDRDRDGIPDRFDRVDNRRWRDHDHRRWNDHDRRAQPDRDRDGVPDWRDRDRDGDGVPNRWDRHDGGRR